MDAFTQDLQPCEDPSAALTCMLKALALANAAQRTELNWQAQNEVHHPVKSCERWTSVYVPNKQHCIDDIGLFFIPPMVDYYL